MKTKTKLKLKITKLKLVRCGESTDSEWIQWLACRRDDKCRGFVDCGLSVFWRCRSRIIESIWSSVINLQFRSVVVNVCVSLSDHLIYNLQRLKFVPQKLKNGFTMMIIGVYIAWPQQMRIDFVQCWSVLWAKSYDTIRYDTRCYFNVRSKADISQLNLPHGTDN